MRASHLAIFAGAITLLFTIGGRCETPQKTGEGSVFPDNLAKVGEPRISIFLDEQELEMEVEGELALVSPISSGRKRGWTPTGQFFIISKSARHRSSFYGTYVSGGGKTLKRNVNSRRDRRPSGARFVGASMPNFLRLTHGGIGIHAGALPGHPASHGCIRVPKEISSLLFAKCPVGTRVRIYSGRETRQKEDEVLDIQPTPSPAPDAISLSQPKDGRGDQSAYGPAQGAPGTKAQPAGPSS